MRFLDGVIWEADLQPFRFKYVSHQLEVLTGYPTHLWLENPDFWLTCIHPEDAGLLQQRFGSAFNPDDLFDRDFRLLTADGRVLWVRNYPLAGSGGGCLRGVSVDVTAKKQEEEALRLEKLRYERLYRLSQMPLSEPETALLDDGLAAAVELTGSQGGYLALLDEEENVSSVRGLHRGQAAHDAAERKGAAQSSRPWQAALRQRCPQITNLDAGLPGEDRVAAPGSWLVSRCANVPVMEDERVVLLAGVTGKALPYSDGDIQQMQTFFQEVWRILKERRQNERNEHISALTRLAVQNLGDVVWIQDMHSGALLFMNEGFHELFNDAGHAMHPLTWLNQLQSCVADRVSDFIYHSTDRQAFFDDVAIRGVDGSVRWFTLRLTRDLGVNGNNAYLVGMLEDQTERRRTRELLRDSEQIAQALLDAQDNLAALFDDQGAILSVNELFARSLGRRKDELIGRRLDQMVGVFPLQVVEDLYHRLSNTCRPAHTQMEEHGRFFEGSGFPILNETGQLSRVAVSIRDITRFKREERKEREQRQLAEALRANSEALIGSINLEGTLDIILQNLEKVFVHAFSTILLMDSTHQVARVAQVRGRTNSVGEAWTPGKEIFLRDSLLLQMVTASGKCLNIPDLSRLPVSVVAVNGSLARACLIAPVTLGPEVLGYLQVISDESGGFTPEEGEKLEQFAQQAAIAIQKARMIQDLESLVGALEEAYDVTIAGWAKALELRDHETEGHSQRVVEMACRLAQAIGYPEEKMTALRWGALLHDIGKLGVPDRILRKPAPLDPDEWIIMRQHPDLARRMLEEIPYLHPAMEIPFSHHESWDGGGYPQGLRGDAIPLSARLFSVVDTWDALTHDRIYRPAWSFQAALSYLRAQSGKKFDPAIVSVFVRILYEQFLEN